MVHRPCKKEVGTVWSDCMKSMKGMAIGDWIVIDFSHLDKKGRAYWKCECQICKNVYAVRGDNLRRGNSSRCLFCKGKR